MSYDLCVFDTHTHPEDNFTRFSWLGSMILEEKPRTLIIGGDLGRVDSMSRHGDKPPNTFKEDLECMHHAIGLMLNPWLAWNKKQRSHRHKPHDMRIVWLEGNHEERARRVAKEDPSGFASLLDWDDPFGFSRWWTERYDYGKIVNINGIDYTHVPRNKMGRPSAQTTVLKQTSTHMIYGHNHTMQLLTTPVSGSDNGVRMSLCAPCYMPDQSLEPYAENLTNGWVYGLLRVRPRGSPTLPFSFDYLDMVTMEELYG